MTETALQTGRFDAAVQARVAIVEDHDLLAQSLGFALSNLGIHVTTMVLAYSALSISCGASVLYLLQATPNGRRPPRPTRARTRRDQPRAPSRVTARECAAAAAGRYGPE